MTKIKTLGISLAVVTALSFGGCGSSSSDTTPASGENIVTSKSYNGAGSRWDLNFKSDGNATIKELDSNLEINATYEDLASGFRKIIVTSSNDSNIANGTVSYGFELPDYMFSFVAFNENKLIPTVTKGSCPTENIKHNYITSFAKSNTKNDSSIASFDSWGTFGYWSTTSNSTQIEVFKRDGTRPDDGGQHTLNYNIVSKNCSNGSFYDPVGDPTDNYRAETTAYFTKAGGLIWHQKGLGNTVGDRKNDRIENDFMIPYEANLNSINQIDGNYIGYVISGNGQSNIGYTNIPVSVVATNGALVVKDINVTSGVIGNKISDISLTTEVTGTKGLWRGQITNVNPSGTDGIGCAIDLDAAGSGKNVIICGGMLPDGTNKKLYSLILVSK